MQTTSTTIQASDIKCNGCANTAKAAVRKLPGVEDVSVNLAEQTVTVKHGPNVPRESLEKALTQAGFPAK